MVPRHLPPPARRGGIAQRPRPPHYHDTSRSSLSATAREFRDQDEEAVMATASLKNQKRIIANQKRIIHNQRRLLRILDNEEKIIRNQKAIIKNQKKILANQSRIYAK